MVSRGEIIYFRLGILKLGTIELSGWKILFCGGSVLCIV